MSEKLEFTSEDMESWAKQARVDLRDEFIRLLTEDSETRDARRREFNQAIFFPEVDGGRAIWTSVDLDMVLSKFDKAVKNLERS